MTPSAQLVLAFLFGIATIILATGIHNWLTG